MIRILVTGGSGFIGTNIIEFYLKKGYEVLNLDIVPPKNRAHLPQWLQIDILDANSLRSAVRRFMPTHVVHLAARTDLDEERDLSGYKANIAGVENIISVLDAIPGISRVIFTSSMYVCRPGYSPQDYDDYSPHTLYGKSKMISERIVKGSTNINFDWVIIRPTSIWGPWFGHPYREFFYHVRKRTYVKMGGKTATKTYGFIDNTIHQIDRILFCPRELVNKRTFYIGDHPGLNINDWADEIASQLGIKLFSVPKLVLVFAAKFGDFAKFLNIQFPIQSFRMKNMTTDNVILLLQDTLEIVPDAPCSVEQGVEKTLAWLKTADPRF